MPYSKKWIDTHPEQFRLGRNGRVNRYRKTTNGKYMASRFTAKKRGLDFTLTLQEFEKLILNDCCYWCGGPLPKTRGGLDRMDNTKGYTPENSIPCCWICNVMKGSMTSEEFIEQCKKILLNHGLRTRK
jgi:hypothetical protein